MTHALQIPVRAALLGGLLSLAACGGGGPAPAGSGPGISGVAAKGLMSGTTVEVFLIDADGFIDGEAPLATAITDEIGQFTLSNRPNPGPLLLRTRGGSYLDESDPAPLADKRRIVLGPDEGFEALLPAGQNTVAITPYSQMLVERARAEAEPGRFIDFFGVIRQRVSGVLGFDPVSDLPADPINPAGASAASRNYAMSLGGFAQQVNSSAIRLGIQPNYAVVRAVQDDMIDGVLDGQNNNEPVLLFIGDDTFVLPVFDFNQQIERFRNNNFGAYGGVTPVVFNEDVLSGPITIDNTPPLVDDFEADVAQGGTLVIEAPGLLDGTSDVDGDQLSVDTTPVSPPQSGELSLDSDGGFTYVHAGGTSTQDSFQFAVIDGNGGRTVASAFISIIPAATSRRYNTAFFEFELLGAQDGEFGEFRVFQDRGFYEIPLGDDPQPIVNFGPFTSVGEGSIVTQVFTFGQEGSSQIYSLFGDAGGQDAGDLEMEPLNRASDGVLFAAPLFEQLLQNFESQVFEREIEDTIFLVPARDDLVVTSLADTDTVFNAISSGVAPQGAYLDGSFTGKLQNEFDAALEIGLEQSDDFDVSRLQGNYGFAGLGVSLESGGVQTFTAFRVEHSPNASGVATGETFDFNEMIYEPSGFGGSTVANPDSGTSSIFQTIYTADPSGTLTIEYREDGELQGTPTGLASPDGEIVVIQEHIVDQQSTQPESVESFFQVGVRRPGGTVDLVGQNFRWNMLWAERSADDQQNDILQFVNVPVSFGAEGACTIGRTLGRNLVKASRITDAGPLIINRDDDGVDFTTNCTYTTGPQGTITITAPGDQQDPNGETYQGYIAASGDVMVLHYVRDETGFFQRGLVIGYADNGLTSVDNEQPDISVSPSSASVGEGQSLDLTATIDDSDDGPAPLSIQWVSTIGAFTSPNSATTQWIAPSGETGTTLLTAVVDDGQRLRIADVPVDFGQTQSLPKAGAEPILGLRRFADNSLLLPDDLDFVFTLFNPFDTRNGSYSCQGDGQQIPDGTVIEQFTDNDANGVISAGDTASLTFNDCADFDIIRNGTIDFSITNNEPVGATEVISYSVVMNFNETLPNEPEYVDYSGNFDVVYEDGSNEIDPVETYNVASSTEFVVTINESGAVPSPINTGVRVSLLAGYDFQISRFFETNEYAVDGALSAVIEEIANDQLSGNADTYVWRVTTPLVGEWAANLPGGPTEAGIPQGLSNPFDGGLFITMGLADLSPPVQNYSFLANGTPGLPGADVQFDTDQDSTFEAQVTATWEDISENRGLGGELQGQIDARSITIDGLAGDWAGRTPNVTQSEGDPAGPDGEVIAVWAAQDAGDLVLRLDVAGTIDPTGFQYDWLFVPYNETETACPEVTLDLDNFSSTSEFCQLFVTSDSGAAFGGCGTDGSSQPVFANSGNVLEAAVPLADVPFATHLKVFYGSAITAPPELQNFDRSFPPFCVEFLD